MSRSGFSIRKLINNPRRSWESDDDSSEETFECSSAKTLRLQHELEQYQTRQIQKAARHPHGHHSTQWIRSHSPSPSKTASRKAPRPITIVRSPSGAVISARNLNPTGRRNSTPHATSSFFPSSSPSLVFPTSTSPAVPLSARSLGDAHCAFSGSDRSQPQHHCQQQPGFPQRAASVLTPSQSPHLSASLPPGWASPKGGPSPGSLSRKGSYEQPPSQNVSTMWLTSPGPQSGGRNMRSSSFSSSQQQPRQSTSAVIYTPNSAVKTPTIIRTFADVTVDSNTGVPLAAMSGPSPQHSTFVNGVPSPPLDPQDIHSGPFGGSMLSLKTVPSVGQLSTASESTWYLGESEREDNTPLSENVEQLIRETDEAFRAVNSALDEAKLMSRCPTPPTEVQSKLNNLQQAAQALQTQTRKSQVQPRRPDPIAITRDTVPRSSQKQLMSPISPLTKAGRGSVLSPRKSKSASPLSPSLQTVRSPTRGASVTKARRGSKSSPKAKAQQQRSASYDLSPPSQKTAAPSSPPSKSGSLNRHQYHSYHKSLSRFNFATEKVTDRYVFEGRGGRFGFHKVDADEIITPEEIEESKKTRLAKAQAEAEAEIRAEARRKISIGTLRSRASSEHMSESESIQFNDSAAESSTTSVGDSGLATPKASEFQKGFMDRTPTDGGKVGQQQSMLATPPPTPPQIPLSAFPSSQAHRNEKDELVQSSNVAGTSTRAGRRPSHSRSNSSLSHIPPLPTIPEVRITAPQVDEIIRQSHQQSGITRSEEQKDGFATSTEGRAVSRFVEDDGEHIFFESSPYTVTQPAFRHGRICLAKADLVNAGTINSLESKLLTSPDETMDWIAFQMAILGGAGDLFHDPNDFLSRDAQENLADDLCDWLEDMGFSNASLGTLVKETKKPVQTNTQSWVTHSASHSHSHSHSHSQSHSQSHSSPEASNTGTGTSTSTSTPESIRQAHFPSRDASLDSRSSSPDSRSSDEIPDGEALDTAQMHNLPIPITSEHPSGYWNTQPLDANRLRKASVSDRGIKRWTLEGRPKRYQGPGIDVCKANKGPAPAQGGAGGNSKLLHPPRTPKSGRSGAVRESMVSLPQSPMLDLVMTTAVDGSKEFVPMGYNLGHDLGDFLKWESEHVYASGFYGSD